MKKAKQGGSERIVFEMGLSAPCKTSFSEKVGDNIRPKQELLQNSEGDEDGNTASCSDRCRNTAGKLESELDGSLQFSCNKLSTDVPFLTNDGRYTECSEEDQVTLSNTKFTVDKQTLQNSKPDNNVNVVTQEDRFYASINNNENLPYTQRMNQLSCSNGMGVRRCSQDIALQDITNSPIKQFRQRGDENSKNGGLRASSSSQSNLESSQSVRVENSGYQAQMYLSGEQYPQYLPQEEYTEERYDHPYQNSTTLTTTNKKDTSFIKNLQNSKTNYQNIKQYNYCNDYDRITRQNQNEVFFWYQNKQLSQKQGDIFEQTWSTSQKEKRFVQSDIFKCGDSFETERSSAQFLDKQEDIFSREKNGSSTNTPQKKKSVNIDVEDVGFEENVSTKFYTPEKSSKCSSSEFFTPLKLDQTATTSSNIFNQSDYDVRQFNFLENSFGWDQDLRLKNSNSMHDYYSIIQQNNQIKIADDNTSLNTTTNNVKQEGRDENSFSDDSEKTVLAGDTNFLKGGFQVQCTVKDQKFECVESTKINRVQKYEANQIYPESNTSIKDFDDLFEQTQSTIFCDSKYSWSYFNGVFEQDIPESTNIKNDTITCPQQSDEKQSSNSSNVVQEDNCETTSVMKTGAFCWDENGICGNRCESNDQCKMRQQVWSLDGVWPINNSRSSTVQGPFRCMSRSNTYNDNETNLDISTDCSEKFANLDMVNQDVKCESQYTDFYNVTHLNKQHNPKFSNQFQYQNNSSNFLEFNNNENEYQFKCGSTGKIQQLNQGKNNSAKVYLFSEAEIDDMKAQVNKVLESNYNLRSSKVQGEYLQLLSMVQQAAIQLKNQLGEMESTMEVVDNKNMDLEDELNYLRRKLLEINQITKGSSTGNT